jgi:hypothetical protein
VSQCVGVLNISSARLRRDFEISLCRRTIGNFISGLLNDNNYHGTILPRIPNKQQQAIIKSVRGAGCFLSVLTN